MAKALDNFERHKNLQILIDRYPGLKRFLSRKMIDRGIEVAPNLYSDDVVWREFVKEEVRLLKEDGEFDAKIVDGKVVNDVRGGYEKLMTIPGFHQYPRPEGIIDNTMYRDELDLPKDFISKRAKDIMEEVFLLMVVRRVDASLPVNAKSISGPPHFIKEPPLKLKYMKRFLDFVAANKDRKPTLAELAAHEFFCFAVVGYRSQVDELKKNRDIILPDGKVIKVNKLTEHTGFVRTRERAVYAFSSDINLAFQALWCGIQKFAFSRYFKTFKVRFSTDVSDRMSRFPHRATVDVSGFDRTVPDFILKFFLDLCRKYGILNECALTILEYLLGAPSFAPSPYLDDSSWGSIVDPLDPKNYYLRRGLPSGIFCVTFLGRWIMSSEMLIKLDHVTKDVLGNVERYFDHEMPHAAFINASDDNFLGTTNADLLGKWLAAPGHFKVEKEPFKEFLGDFFMDNELGGITPVPNIVNMMFINRDVPEHGIGNEEGERRAGWYTGWTMVKDLAMKHRLYNKAMLIKNKAMLHATGGTRDYEAVMKSKEEPLKLFPGLTDADRWFVTNPDSIHYKIDIDDVSKELLELTTQAQSPELTTQWAKVMAGPGIIWM